MSFIEWSPALSVGVTQIDDQHRRLVGMLNDLHDAMKARRGREALGAVLDGLIAYTVEHFTAEEALMQASRFTQLPTHRIEHDKLKRQVGDLQRRHRAGEVTITLDTMNFLRDWLSAHIQRSDKAAGAHIAASR